MGGRRNFRAARCARCGVHDELCVCDRMPRVSLETRLLLVQNAHERNKPTNTGRLAALMLENSQMLHYAVRGEVFDPTPLESEALDYLLVFHREGEQEQLSPQTDWGGGGRTRALVFLDGTWAQCSRMSRRVPGLEKMRTVSLPPGPPSPWRVRGETHPDRLSTLEAIIRAIELVEGPAPAAIMREWFYLVTARLMFMKAMLRSPEVPPEWLATGPSASDAE